MNKSAKLFLTAIKLFLFQTGIEVAVIVILLYLGIPFFEMKVGKEHFYEIVVGVFGFYALIKCVYYGIIYCIGFTAFGIILKINSEIGYSILNAILSIFYILLFLINGRDFNWILNPAIATFASCLIVTFTLSRWKFSESSKIS